MLEAQYYELIDPKGFIFGFAFDAETGEPLVGAKAVAKQGTTVTGTDYVPYYGYRTYFYPDTIATEGYGLFSVLTDTGNNKLILNKKKYAKPTLTDMTVAPDMGTYAGNVPVPPNKGKYWLAVTWDYGYFGTDYDAVLWVPGYGYVGWFDPGNLNASPYAKLFWDSFDWSGTLRAFSEVIRIKKTVTGQYFFYIDDLFTGAGSTTWFASGIKVYIYKWNAATAKLKLVKTYTPPAGAGQYWDICNIQGNKITDINNLTD